MRIRMMERAAKMHGADVIICTREPDLVAVDVHWLVGLLHNVRLGNNNATRTTTPNLSNNFPRILLSCEQILP